MNISFLLTLRPKVLKNHKITNAKYAKLSLSLVGNSTRIPTNFPRLGRYRSKNYSLKLVF